MFLRAETACLAAVILLAGCSSAVVPTFLKPSQEDSTPAEPSSLNDDVEAATDGKGLDEPIPVAGAFLVCMEDQSLIDGAVQFEIGCRLQDEKGERVGISGGVDVKFALLAADGSIVPHEVVFPSLDPLWDWHVTTDSTVGFPEAARLILTLGKRVETYESKISRQPAAASVYNFFQLGDNLLNVGLAPATDCTVVTANVIEDRHGLTLNADFVVKARTRLQITMKDICGVELTADVRILDVTANKEIAKAAPVDGNWTGSYALTPGTYRFVLKNTFKAPDDADDFAVGDLSFQALNVEDVEGLKITVMK